MCSGTDCRKAVACPQSLLDPDSRAASPCANLFWTAVLTIIIGVTIASAFTAILVYAQELMHGNIGPVSGIFFGFAFGMRGLGVAVLGKVADMTSIGFVFHVCSFLPAIGLLAAFLPRTGAEWQATS